MDATVDGVVLVKLALTNIAGYVLDTENLSVTRASSDRLDRLAREAAAALAGGEVIYAAGSEVLVYFDDLADPAEAVRRVAESFASVAEDAPLVTAVCEGVSRREGEDLDDALARLDNLLRRAQMAQCSVVPGRLTGSGECTLDGVRPADETAWVGDRTRPVSAHTKRRLQEGRPGRRRRAEAIFGGDGGPERGGSADAAAEQATHRLDESLEGLGRFSPPGVMAGKMCVLQVDGNRFGAYRARLDDAGAWRVLTDLVETAMTASMRYALGDLWRRAGEMDALPVHILYCAGDEFRVIVPATAGVAAAGRILEAFSGQFAAALADVSDAAMRERLAGALEGESLTLAVGAVFCDLHEPITSATSAAGWLNESAKSLIRTVADARSPEAGNVVDFMVVESGMIPASLRGYREANLRRPASPGAASPDGPRGMLRGPLSSVAFAGLVEDVRVLRRAGFPTGRAAALATLLLHEARDDQVEATAWELFERVEWPVLEDRLDGDRDALARLRGLRPSAQAECRPGSPVLDPWLARREIWDYVDDQGGGSHE